MIHISDRRLSHNGNLVDDESNKCGVIFCNNARMVFGYTGLAAWGNFSTMKWLLKSLHDSAAPDFTIGETLERVKTDATETFNNHPVLKYVDRKHKKLSVMFSGYINLNGNQKQGCAILSNCINFTNNTAYATAQDSFQIHYSSAKNDEKWPTLVQRVGNWSAMTNEHITELRDLLSQNKPTSAISGKAIDIINSMADSPRSSGTIGKQLMVVKVPFDNNQEVDCSYHSNITKPETFMPALVYLMPKQHLTVENISVTPVDPDTAPISVPKVGKNQNCPCGSKRKYKHCHGKKRKNKR